MRNGIRLSLGTLLFPSALLLAQDRLPPITQAPATQQTAARPDKAPVSPDGPVQAPEDSASAPAATEEPVSLTIETAPEGKKEPVTVAPREDAPPSPKEPAAESTGSVPAAAGDAASPPSSEAPVPPTDVLRIETEVPSVPGMPLSLPAPPALPATVNPVAGTPPVAAPAASNSGGSCSAGTCCESDCCGDCCGSRGIVGRFFGAFPGDPNPQVWANAEFLLWWTKNAPVDPPLVTQAMLVSPGGFAAGAAGSLASPNTNILLGASNYGVGTRYGGRFTLGAWLDPEQLLGVEGSYLFLGPSSSTNLVGSNGSLGSPAIGAPYLNAVTGTPSFAQTSFPGAAAGGAFLTLSNSLQAAELNGLGRLISNDNVTISGLLGARYLYFNEDLNFGTGAIGLPGSLPFPGLRAATLDHFEGTNNFWGGQMGLRGEYRLGNFFINGTGKVALGVVNQAINVNGAAGSIFPGGPPAGNFFLPTGFYALSTNSGHFSRSSFAVVPEVNLNVGYNVTRNIRVYAGWTFLYINNVVRPGQQINQSINPIQSPTLAGVPAGPTPLAPTIPFNHTDFWAQGLNLGMSLRW